LIIAAWNERKNIGSKLDNCLALDYPAERLEIVVALDGCTDGTERVVEPYLGRGVAMLESATRDGKAVRLNEAVDASTGEVLVFADARQVIDSHAIRELVAALSDPSVGVVSGELVLGPVGSSNDVDSGAGPSLYWRYEKWIRAMESDINSMLGATGALYAIERKLFEPIPAGTILDDVAIPMRAVMNGKRAVLESRAKVYDTACEEGREFERKVRTLTGNFQLLAIMPELLNPFRNPVFLQYVSHKVSKLAVPYFLVAMLVSNGLVRDGLYFVSFAGQLLVYFAASVGAIVSRKEVLLSVEGS
jgi:cellulose synthase/poly-beta-1,6-N-acetylglucosamine synthase-like glycosyltransferase